RVNALTEAFIGAAILFIVALLGTLPPAGDDASTAHTSTQSGGGVVRCRLECNSHPQWVARR
ncbi:MAG: hypothetical protein JO228_11835, partial [Xanthobacteraceae bacterium]|nr:hypothetical protein [Xanthobacteraceae bacterium]